MGFLDFFRRRPAKADAKRDAYAATYGNGSPGGFAGAAVNRLTSSMATWSGALNADLDGSLVVLRARARQLAANNAHGRRFLTLVATNVVGGEGMPRLQVRALKDQRNPDKPTVLDKAANDAIEVHWALWGQTADLAGRQTWTMMLRMIAKTVARDGEALVRLVRRRDLPYGLALQLLDIDRLDEGLNRAATNGGNALRQGVELDSTGRAVAYWVRTAHPGEAYAVAGAAQYERIPAGDLVHVFLPERPEQVRGYPWFHAVLLDTQQLGKFREAAVIAARVGASKIAALQRSEDSLDQTALMADSASGGAMSMNVEAGEMFELPPGYTLNSWDPEYPHANFDSFVKSCMRGIAAGLDVAAHNLTGDMTDVNYSSARIAELAEREQWTALQDWLINAMVRPVFREWLSIALLRGDVAFPVSGKALPFDKYAKFAAASHFQGRRWAWVDPKNEVESAQLLIENGLASRTEIAAAKGRDFDDILDELKQEKAQLAAAGLGQPAAAEPTPEDQAARLAVAARMLDPAPAGAPTVNVNVAPQHITLNQAEIRVDVPPQAVTIAQPAIHNEIRVEPTPIHIAAPEIRNEITVEPTPVTLEANIDMPPTQVQVQLPARRTETLVERDAAGNIARATQVEQDA
jgi:lambda family phage portal protein